MTLNQGVSSQHKTSVAALSLLDSDAALRRLVKEHVNQWSQVYKWSEQLETPDLVNTSSIQTPNLVNTSTIQTILSDLETLRSELRSGFLAEFARHGLSSFEGFVWLSLQLWLEVPTELVRDFYFYRYYTRIKTWLIGEPDHAEEGPSVSPRYQIHTREWNQTNTDSYQILHGESIRAQLKDAYIKLDDQTQSGIQSWSDLAHIYLNSQPIRERILKILDLAKNDSF